MAAAAASHQPVGMATATNQVSTVSARAIASGDLELPPLPATVAEVLSARQTDTIDAVRLSAIIHRDPALAASILRVANSAAYVGQEQSRVLQQAISRLGLRHVTEIAMGVYALPAIGSSGLDVQAAIAAGLGVVVGRANFAEIARGHINGNEDGLLKLVVDAATRRIAGCQVVGEGATELVHIAQMAMAAEAEVDTLVERVFNFPTMAEAYRVAALDAVGRIEARRAPVAP